MGKEFLSATSVYARVEWKCSACGTDNSQIRSLACNPDIISANEAENGYDKLQLSCKCEACGHRESWAKISVPWIKWTKTVFKAAVTVLGLYVAALLLEALTYDLESVLRMRVQDSTPVILAAAAIAWGCFSLWDHCRRKKLRTAVRMLPATALPAFSKPENRLYKAPADKTETAAVSTKPRVQERSPAQYTEEELKQLPAWKRVEIMKQRDPNGG